MKAPNFFILGAGRCGTTTLHHMLKQHKQIFMSKVKEPSFFCSYFQIVKNPIDYFQLFKYCKNEIAIGESSHVYFSNPETPQVLHSLFPDAKFVLIFRNPTNRAYSMYNWARNKGVESIKTFKAAIKIENKRYNDPKFFKNCPYYFWNFMYTKSSYYHIQWKRYLKYYNRDQFLVLNLYEFSNDPHYWVERVHDFLGVDTSFRPIVEHRHKAKYKPMDLKIRKFLDEHFKETIYQTEKLAGYKLHLDKI